VTTLKQRIKTHEKEEEYNLYISPNRESEYTRHK